MGVTVNIRGKEFPLCLTVAALDKINDKCGGLSGITQFLMGNPSQTEGLNEEQLNELATQAAIRAKVNNAWMLGMLVQEGEENRLIEERFLDDGDLRRRKVPGPEEMLHLLTPSQIEEYRLPILMAVNAGMKRNFEAVPSKNVDQAGER